MTAAVFAPSLFVAASLVKQALALPVKQNSLGSAVDQTLALTSRCTVSCKFLLSTYIEMLSHAHDSERHYCNSMKRNRELFGQIFGCSRMGYVQLVPLPRSNFDGESADARTRQLTDTRAGRH